jgi:hypothetical protein
VKYRPSAFLFRWCRLVEHPSYFPLFRFRKGWRSGSLGLQQSPEKNPVIPPGAFAAHVAGIGLVADVLSLKDFGFPFPALLTEHESSIALGDQNRMAT